MLAKSLKCSQAAKQNVIDITVLILLVTQFIGVYGVPINFVNNNKNNYNENHANRPLQNQPPPVPPLQRPAIPYQKQQTSQNQGPPEMEDFGRLHTNQKQFRRHAIVLPDGKTIPGAFQQNPPEKFGQAGGASGGGPNFRQNMFDELHHSNRILRHSPPPPSFAQTEDASDFHQRSSAHGRNNNFQARKRSHDVPPGPTSYPNQFTSQHEEARANNHIPNQQHYQQMLNDNEIFRERNGFPHARPAAAEEWIPTFPREMPPVGQQWQEQQPTSFPNTFMPLSGQNSVSGKPNNVPVSSTLPQPTAVAIIVPGGNSTLFIEYDVSDNDVTYETIVEVEDLPENVLISNHVSPI